MAIWLVFPRLVWKHLPFLTTFQPHFLFAHALSLLEEVTLEGFAMRLPHHHGARSLTELASIADEPEARPAANARLLPPQSAQAWQTLAVVPPHAVLAAPSAAILVALPITRATTAPHLKRIAPPSPAKE